MKTLKQRLKEGLKNCYIMSGDDYYLYERAYEMIKKVANIELEDFNLVKFDDENFSMKGLLDSCEVMPMGSEKRLILVKNIVKVTENDKKLLEDYLEAPVESTIIVIFDYFDKFSSIKNCERVDCKRFDNKTALVVIASELEKKGKQISTEAGQTLLDYCNGYLTRVNCELDKLAYYDITSPLITKKMVEELVSKDTDYVVFELTEALGQKNADKALKILEKMIKEQGVLGLITNHFRRLFFISISDMTDNALSGLLGVKEYAIRKQREQVKNFSKLQLKKIYALLEEVDYKIKSGAMLADTALNYLVLSILYI